jgi:predicted SAM-dependent methyltransferase
MKLHLGCSDKRLAGWTNCNGEPGPAVDLVLSIPAGLPTIADGSVEWLYSSHMIEHVAHDSQPAMFAQFKRIMAPGGKITLATIDINGIYHNRYKKGLRSASWNAALYGETWGMERPYISHLVCFDEEMLIDLLLNAGFKNVRHWETPEYPEIAALIDCATRDRDVSLLLEATA